MGSVLKPGTAQQIVAVQCWETLCCRDEVNRCALINGRKKNLSIRESYTGFIDGGYSLQARIF